MLLLGSALLHGCAYLPDWTRVSEEDKQMAEAREALSQAKTEHARKADAATERKVDMAQKSFEDKALETALQLRKSGEWHQAESILDQALQQLPDSKRLQDSKSEISTERKVRLARNDCRLGAARARYLADKSELLKTRAPLEAKDYLQDWLSRRERSELDQLGEQLRECSEQALVNRNLDLAEELIQAAARARGEEFISAQQNQLDHIRKPPVQAEKRQVAKEQPERRTITPQQKIRQHRAALQSAMTRGNLKQAKAALVELRKLEGDTQQLKELGQSIDDAIAAHVEEINERASAHYRDKQIEQARDLWKQILDIDPDNSQARANLERAERVLKKLEELQGTSPEVTPEAAATENKPGADSGTANGTPKSTSAP